MHLSSRKVMGVLHRKVGAVISGCENITADFMSKTFNENTEWSLPNSIFQSIMRHFSFVPVVDLFATSAKERAAKYVSWYPEPASYTVDPIKLDWRGLQFYGFHHLPSSGC